MKKWYVEWRTWEHGELKVKYMNKVEAEDGKAAIEYVKQHIKGPAFKFWVDHDDDEEEEEG